MALFTTRDLSLNNFFYYSTVYLIRKPVLHFMNCKIVALQGISRDFYSGNFLFVQLCIPNYLFLSVKKCLKIFSNYQILNCFTHFGAHLFGIWAGDMLSMNLTLDSSVGNHEADTVISLLLWFFPLQIVIVYPSWRS